MSDSVYWYRYEDYLVSAGVDEFENPLGPAELRIRLREIEVVRTTPKGVRLDCGRFVLNKSKKRYACATIEEAKESFIARKTRQAHIYANRLRHTQMALFMIKYEYQMLDPK